MNHDETMGRLLADRHNRPGGSASGSAHPTPAEKTLLDVAECPRTKEWTMRSSLVRLAQREPGRAGATLELVRRIDGALRGLRRSLEQHPVVADRGLSPASFRSDGGQWLLDEPAEPYTDVRATDVARLCRLRPEGADALMASYSEGNSSPLEAEELQAIPLLVPALELDGLADILAEWAVSASSPPPNDAIDKTGALVFSELERLGVARESGPRGRG